MDDQGTVNQYERKMAHLHTHKTMQGTSCWRTDLQGLSTSQMSGSYSNWRECTCTSEL